MLQLGDMQWKCIVENPLNSELLNLHNLHNNAIFNLAYNILYIISF